MSALDTVLARSRPASAAKATPIPAPSWALRAADNERYTIPELETVEAQARYATKLSWIEAAVGTVSRMAAATPFQVKQRDGEGATAIKNHPFEQRLQRPNALQSRFEFLEATFAWRKIAGNCYWWLNRTSENDPPSELWIIPAHQIQPIPDGRSYLRGYLYDAGDGIKMPLETWEVCHFKTFNPLNKFVGLSELQSLRLSAIGDLAAQEWNTNFYAKDNAKIGGVLAFADPIPDPDWFRLKDEIKREHGGSKGKRMMLLRNAGKGGVEWIATQLSQDDMQFLQQRQFTKEEIWSLLAPGLAAMLAINANEANARQGDATLRALAIYPAHTAIGETITNDILPSYGDNLVGEFEDMRLKDAALDLQVAQTRRAWWSVNELRAEEGKTALPGELWESIPATAALRMFNPDLRAELTGLSEAPAPPPPTALPFPPAAPPLQLTGPAPTTIDATLSDSTQSELAMQDLAKWERKALKRLDKGLAPACGFESEVIAPAHAYAVRRALESATDKDSVLGAMKAKPKRVTTLAVTDDIIKKAREKLKDARAA